MASCRRYARLALRFTVVFILSTNYSGSHLLAQLLGSHSRCLSIGELHNYSKLRDRLRRDRDIVNDYATNPLFDGLGDRTESQWHARIFENSRAYRPTITALVDNSKRVAWAERFLESAFDAVYLHLLRDPRAIVSRWLATYDTSRARRSQRRRLARRQPSLVATALLRPIDVVLAQKWVLANAAITEFLSTRSRTAVVLYDELSQRTAPALAALMPTLGLEFEAGQLEYGRVAHAGTLKRAYLGASARSLIAPDLRWRDALPANVIGRIDRSRPILDYLAKIGVELDADGLRRLR